MAPLSWKPRVYKRGGVARYCAPACGANCPRAEYDRADRLAAHMVVALPGKGWRKHLNENMGWFARAEHGTGVEVFAAVRDGVTYSASYRTWHAARYRTPRTALRSLLRAVKRDVDLDQDALARLAEGFR